MRREISTRAINKDIERLTPTAKQNVSDGYHTFEQLYDDRASFMYVSMLTNSNNAWISLKHNDGTMFDGMFIAGITMDNHNIIYHIDLKFFNLFSVFDELEIAPEWDRKDNSMNMFIKSLFDRHPDYITL